MTERLAVYGFGSFFASDAHPRDIDLLLLHSSTDKESCQFAVACKALIQTLVASADVIILAEEEAASLRFFERAKTILLGEVTSDCLHLDVAEIARALPPLPAIAVPAGSIARV